MNINHNQIIKFVLYGDKTGTGRVKEVHSHCVNVELIEPFMDFDAGAMLRILNSEICIDKQSNAL